MPGPNDIVVISSLVSRGAVGGRATTFALERLGFRVWLVPTTILSHHPGHSGGHSIELTAAQLGNLLDDLSRDEWLSGVRAVVTGYFRSDEQVECARDFLDRARAVSPGLTYLCDPILGDYSPGNLPDEGQLYVAKSVADAVKNLLLQQSDIATPNLFEARWLTGVEGGDLSLLASEILGWAVSEVLVTGVPGLMRGAIGTLLCEAGHAHVAEHPQVKTQIKGTGDVFCGLYLGHRLRGTDPIEGLKLAAAGTFEALNEGVKRKLDEFDLPSAQDRLLRPHTLVSLRQMHLKSLPPTSSKIRTG